MIIVPIVIIAIIVIIIVTAVFLMAYRDAAKLFARWGQAAKLVPMEGLMLEWLVSSSSSKIYCGRSVRKQLQSSDKAPRL